MTPAQLDMLIDVETEVSKGQGAAVDTDMSENGAGEYATFADAMLLSRMRMA